MFGKAFSRLLVPALFFLLASLPAWGDSQVRIVRLSYLAGTVTIDRGTGHFEPAIVNLPITQGMKLQTKDDRRAEVEFEDGSALRLAPDTSVRFSRLSLRAVVGCGDCVGKKTHCKGQFTVRRFVERTGVIGASGRGEAL